MNSDPAIVDDTSIDVIEPYDLWAEGGGFSNHSNDDGIANGLAWLLGAANPNQDARSLLPEVSSDQSGDLVMVFTSLKVAARGAASIKVQYSKDLGNADSWDGHQAEVPDTSVTDAPTGIEFTIQSLEGNYISVLARIPASAALPGTKLFGRIKGVSP